MPVWQNLAPGAASRLGLSSASLREKHPSLITVDISGYGEQGAKRDYKAYDLLVCDVQCACLCATVRHTLFDMLQVQAESGLCSVTGTSKGGEGRVGLVFLCVKSDVQFVTCRRVGILIDFRFVTSLRA